MSYGPFGKKIQRGGTGHGVTTKRDLYDNIGVVSTNADLSNENSRLVDMNDEVLRQCGPIRAIEETPMIIDEEWQYRCSFWNEDILDRWFPWYVVQRYLEKRERLSDEFRTILDSIKDKDYDNEKRAPRVPHGLNTRGFYKQMAALVGEETAEQIRRDDLVGPMLSAAPAPNQTPSILNKPLGEVPKAQVKIEDVEVQVKTEDEDDNKQKRAEETKRFTDLRVLVHRANDLRKKADAQDAQKAQEAAQAFFNAHRRFFTDPATNRREYGNSVVDYINAQTAAFKAANETKFAVRSVITPESGYPFEGIKKKPRHD